MSFRRKLILFSSLLGVVLGFLLPVFQRLELSSYDRRVREVRTLRGNQAPSRATRWFGLTESTLDKIKNWGVAQESGVYSLAEQAGAVSIWVDPNLGWSNSASQQMPPLTPDLDGTLREVELADASGLSPELKMYASLKGVSPESVAVGEQTITVGQEILPRRLAVDFPLHTTGDATDGATSQKYLEPPPVALLFDDKGQPIPQSDSFAEKHLKGKAVLFVDHTQVARTRYGTPMGDLERHQIVYSALDTLLSGWRLWKPVAALSWLGALLLSGIAAWGATRSPSILLTFLCWGAFSLSYWEVARRAFVLGYYLPVVPVIFGVLLTIVFVAATLQVRAFRLMKQLVGEERAADAARGEIGLGGTERIVTILFTNLPKAIQELEQTDPEESIRARNHYNAYFTQGVRNNGGRVLDYQGDFQMAGFCVERVDPEHAINAVRAGLELCRTLSEQYPDESIHCGVCTGPAAVGYVGAPSSKELAAIGDTTNVAARLLGAAKKGGIPLLVSEPTYNLCSEHLVAEKLPAVSLKGKTSDVEVYSVEAVRNTDPTEGVE